MVMNHRAFLSVSILSLLVVAPFVHAEPPKQQSSTLYENELLSRQYSALLRMPDADVKYSKFGAVKRIKGRTGVKIADLAGYKPGDPVPQVVAALSDVLLAAGTETLTVWSNEAIPGIRSLFVKQSIRGVPVIDGGVSLGVDPATGEVIYLESYFVPDRSLPSRAAIAVQDAAALAVRYIKDEEQAEPESIMVSDGTALGYYSGAPDDDIPALVWVVKAEFLDADGPVVEEIWVDAVAGLIKGKRLLSQSAFNRSVYSANGTAPPVSNLPQGVTYLFGEGGSSSNVSGMTAYSHTWTAREAWRVNFGKELVGSIGIVVSYATNRGGIYDKNSSTGVNWLILDNGTSATSTTSRDLDAVAHEYGHGVFDQVVAAHSTIPSFDDFAMSEGYADFSSVLTTRYASGNSLPPAPAVWQLLDVKLPNQQPIRSWSSPRSVSSQARDWYTDRSTAIDPHNNSHVMGHALYLLSQGGVHARVGGPVSDRPGAVIPSINVPAQGFDKMIRIFNAAFGYPGMQAYPDFLKLREAMEDRAYTLYGMAS